MHRFSIALATAFLSLAACTSDSTTPQQRRLLSDLDRDGYFSSEECATPDPVHPPCGGPGEDHPDDPTGGGTTGGGTTGGGTTGGGGTAGEPGCVVVPGPTDCLFLEVDAEGCYQCLDEAGQPTGDPWCDTTESPTCEPVIDDGSGVTCWECTDGDVTYRECYEEPDYCATDADCGAGQTCVIPVITCPEGEACPALAAAGVCSGGDDDGTPPPTPPTEPTTPNPAP